jgi:RNA polymerase sigma-70 factor (ECF subfamily)
VKNPTTRLRKFFLPSRVFLHEMKTMRLPEHDLPDAELARRAQTGDSAAFDALNRRYRGAVLALAFARTGDREAAEDLAQETLCRAWRSLHDLHDPSAFAGWLRAIAVNACRDWFRRSRPWPESLDDTPAAFLMPDPQPRPLAVLLEREKQRALRQALRALPLENQRALLMHVWGGCSYEQIAAFLDMPLTTVEGRIHRARAQLRRLLRAEADDLLADVCGSQQTQEGKRWR